jgi:phenylpropionate dioxygenase-like ring-hydroxylating dioxygenase large terminal subunit
MAILDHWQPIYPSRWLRKKPIAVKRLGRELVLFRAGPGSVGMLADACPHRGMRLSKGWVDSGQVVCPYHGWCFGPSGHGESPGTPRLPVRTSAYEVADHQGVIWIKDPRGTGKLHPLQFEGYELLYLAYRPMKAPVESLLENFTEIEHTGTAHWQFGYPAKRMSEVVVETETSAEAVRVKVEGPQMWLWPTSELAMGMRTGDLLKFDWTTRFDPLHTSADFWWEDPRSHQVRPCRFKEVAYFVPVGPDDCLLVSYYFWSWQGAVRRFLRHLLRPFLLLGLCYELRLDQWLIENVIPASLYQPGRRLGRFDRPLQEERKRWQHCRSDECEMPLAAEEEL